jgi:hypothetical protein
MPDTIHTQSNSALVGRADSPDALDSITPMIAAGVPHYRRERDLRHTGLILFQSEIEDFSAEGIGYVVSRIEERLRAERRAALAGHWAYSVNRHTALHIAHEAELKALARAECNARLLAAE